MALERYGVQAGDAPGMAAFLRRVGADVPVTEIYQDGQVIDLGVVTLEVLHIPGHTPGNLSLYDRTHHALLHGESVMGAALPDEQGRRATPFGRDPGAYRRGLERLTAIEFDLFLSSHRPPLDGAGGHALITESLAVLEEYERACRAALAQGAPDAPSLAEAVAAEGHYRSGALLVAQVGHTLQGWLEAGLVVITLEGGYRLKG
jgi:glyoxylase-like metal-dependent hydrolase (beta-lactamase superfamily II)